MSADIRLSRKAARRVVYALEVLAATGSAQNPMLDQDIGDLRSALAPKQKKPWARVDADRAARKKTKQDARKAVRVQVFERADGRCENCNNHFHEFDAGELDHFFGRVRQKESAETCWALCRGCHRRKTRNTPSAASWCRAFIRHAMRCGLRLAALEAERLLAKHEARAGGA